MATDTAEAFVYDRILTALDRRRKGLGRALTTALRETRHDPNLPELFIATADGRALYPTLGWETLSTYRRHRSQWSDCGPWRIADPTFNLAVFVQD
ncbi:hypothetical protein E5673_11415 [Sphingomonas sp. PAMC26645]|uniref:hypothetical protein n=1 Tax=Sphingomonas sp. PAMC26645 TaxID=2565555 RepID=UPI00109D9AEC|nr:hypothetical protein [Sphingomonas sp. PAMC26645]QCB42752.1 hypothetical protein E5673_11415 [Sphingomonas sp. PAMC26645]